MTDDDPGPDRHDLTDVPTVGPGEPVTPPAWARKERALLAAAEEAAVTFVDRYTREDGSLRWRASWPGMDGSDDPYEAFQGLPMLYLLGGGDRLLDLTRRQWEAVTRQWTAYGQIHREYDGYYDWMHHGEADNLLRLWGMADPRAAGMRERIVRFAGFYTGEDPDAPNYDPRRRLVRSPLTGSRGPRFTATAEDWSTHRDVLDAYPPPFEDIPGVDGPTCRWTDDRVFDEILQRMNARMTRGDVPLNLTATSLLAHAYLLTGEDRYARWVLDYHDAWRQRAARNGGIIPDNVGPDDVIGQHMQGQWWGGYYGWRWPHGAPQLLEAVAIGSTNAALLSGDTGPLDLIRSQLDRLWELGRDQDGAWMVPRKHLDAGWTDYRPLAPHLPLACWSLSHDPEDARRVLRLSGSASWGTPTQRIAKGNGAANSQHWFAFLHGRNADYPDEILGVNHEQLEERLDEIAHDDGNPQDWDIHHWQDKSPILTEGLVQLMLGAPLHLYHGGLQHATVRYYDEQRRRPGVPPDVAALVERVDATGATLTLVNCGEHTERDVLVQAGAFAEHTIVTATMVSQTRPEEVTPVRGPWLRVRLGRSAKVRLRLELRRLSRTPSYVTPWDADR
jgi:hypothetical protein